jgi:hypothetical protein
MEEEVNQLKTQLLDEQALEGEEWEIYTWA